MKIINWSLTILLFLPNYYISSAQQYFNRIHHLGAAGGAWAVISTDSCYYLYGGILDSNLNLHRAIYFSRFSLTGDLIFSKTWGELYHEYSIGFVSPMIETSDGNFILAGCISDTIQTWAILVKCDANGDTLWWRNYYDTLNHYPDNIFLGFYGVKETMDGGFVMVGELPDTVPPQYSNAFIFKVDSLGNREWHTIIGATNWAEEAFSVIQTPDSGYLAGGKTYNPNYLDISDAVVYKLDKYGNYQWQKQFGGYLNDLRASVAMSLDGNYLISFSNAYKGAGLSIPDREFWVIKLAPNQQVIWTKKYRIHCDSNVKNIVELKDSSILVVGTALVCDTINNAAGFVGFLIKLDNNGDSIWYRNYYYQSYFISGAENVPWDVKPTDDGGFISAGYFINHYQPINQAIWLVKMDSLGCDTPGCQYAGIPVYESILETLKIYPNPARDVVNVEIVSNVEWRVVSVELVDMFGKVMLRGEMEAGKSLYSISVKELPEGMYILRIMVRDGMIRRKIVVVQ